MTDIYEPQYLEWQAVLAANITSRPMRQDVLGSERIRVIREELLACAQQHTAELIKVASQCDVGNLSIRTPSVAGTKNILMAGHQPTAYHSGILCKVQALAKLSDESGSLGVNVVIDTDEGDSGALVWPRVSQGILEIKRASIATHSPTSTLYANQRVVEASRVREIFSDMEQDLRESGLIAELEQVLRVARLYENLAGESLVTAHTVVRWAVSDARTLEVPLSVLVQQAAVRAVLQGLVSDGVRLASIYNATLDEYRHEHRIRNPANPFPNMRTDESGVELPLWRIGADGRQPAFVGSQYPSQICGPHEYLAPRGSMTTMILRGFCSDLFIHGLGGGKYDQFVDRCAAAYLGVQLPAFVVASRTRYIFPERVAELQRAVELASKIKEITSKTEQYLNQGIFTTEEEVALRKLILERNTFKEALQSAATPEAKSAAAHTLNDANRKVRSLVETGSLRDVVTNAAAHEAMLARWSYREFPFFLWTA
jgi:hypothetical protein